MWKYFLRSYQEEFLRGSTMSRLREKRWPNLLQE
jgi:hypothetical protein